MTATEILSKVFSLFELEKINYQLYVSKDDRNLHVEKTPLLLLRLLVFAYLATTKKLDCHERHTVAGDDYQNLQSECFMPHIKDMSKNKERYCLQNVAAPYNYTDMRTSWWTGVKDEEVTLSSPYHFYSHRITPGWISYREDT
ncbi:hypothetical protein AVEN_136762-1 [Araneus ventricosus]|uniref:Uncharacterized protein n=1 Tax=Araneus ventricosus TaxID=182803 RepID=A0A4Y2PRF5_ARAVE|nr:hypothetical protein AVEN_133173-1 [Araneus ventricosus]GBN53692.1 hypothetical protein AVEN_136762-1 [Araneus ventricosus]